MDERPDPQLLERVRRLMAERRLAVLATQADDRPYGNLVTFAATEDLTSVLFPTPRSSRKFANLCRNAHVALIVDNREDAERNPADGLAVTLEGTARELTDADRIAAMEALRSRHPALEDFLADPDCALIAIEVIACTVAHGLSDVRRWSP